MRISRSEPIVTSKRVTKAAPFLHKFSLEVSSVKTTPRESRPVTCIGSRTEILRSARCFESCVLVCMVGRHLVSDYRIRFNPYGCLALKKSFHCIKHFRGRQWLVNRSSELHALFNT